jgi:hypothetical protein
LVRFEANTSETGLIAGLADGLAAGTAVGVDVVAGRVVGDGLGEAAPVDAEVDGDAERTPAGDDPQAATAITTARTAVTRATITRHPSAGRHEA